MPGTRRRCPWCFRQRPNLPIRRKRRRRARSGSHFWWYISLYPSLHTEALRKALPWSSGARRRRPDPAGRPWYNPTGCGCCPRYRNHRGGNGPRNCRGYMRSDAWLRWSCRSLPRPARWYCGRVIYGWSHSVLSGSWQRSHLTRPACFWPDIWWAGRRWRSLRCRNSRAAYPIRSRRYVSAAGRWRFWPHPVPGSCIFQGRFRSRRLPRERASQWRSGEWSLWRCRPCRCREIPSCQGIRHEKWSCRSRACSAPFHFAAGRASYGRAGWRCYWGWWGLPRHCRDNGQAFRRYLPASLQLLSHNGRDCPPRRQASVAGRLLRPSEKWLRSSGLVLCSCVTSCVPVPDKW